MNHTPASIAATYQCHNRQSFTGVTPVSKPSNHITTRRTVRPATRASSASRRRQLQPLGRRRRHLGNPAISRERAGRNGQACQSRADSLGCPPRPCRRSTAVGGFAAYTVGNAGHAALGVILFSWNCMTCHTWRVSRREDLQAAPRQTWRDRHRRRTNSNCQRALPRIQAEADPRDGKDDRDQTHAATGQPAGRTMPRRTRPFPRSLFSVLAD